MYTIVSIFTGQTDKGVKIFKNYLKTLSSKEDVLYARVRYNTSKLVNEYDHPFKYPLCVYTKNDIVFCIADVAAGYPGTGPHGMVELLKYLGFSFDEDDILSHQNIVMLDFIKEEGILRNSFKTYELDERDYVLSPFHTY